MVNAIGKSLDLASQLRSQHYVLFLLVHFFKLFRDHRVQFLDFFVFGLFSLQ